MDYSFCKFQNCWHFRVIFDLINCSARWEKNQFRNCYVTYINYLEMIIFISWWIIMVRVTLHLLFSKYCTKKITYENYRQSEAKSQPKTSSNVVVENSVTVNWNWLRSFCLANLYWTLHIETIWSTYTYDWFPKCFVPFHLQKFPCQSTNCRCLSTPPQFCKCRTFSKVRIPYNPLDVIHTSRRLRHWF